MLENKIEKELLEILKKYSEEERDIILGNSVLRNIQQTSEKYNLSVAVAAILEKEILLVMLGINSASAFISRLTSQGIVEENAKLIALDIEKLIFKPTKEALLKVKTRNNNTKEESGKEGIKTDKYRESIE